MTEPSTIHDIIFRFKSNAKGIDGLSLQMIKLSLPVTLMYRTHNVICCLQKGYFPNLEKSVSHRPIPKVSNPANLSDLNPISFIKNPGKSYL